MSDTPLDFDAVVRGPELSDPPDRVDAESEGSTPGNPTVDAMRARFDEAVEKHIVCAGDQHVVYIEAGANIEVLTWLKEDADQHFDHLADVTAVDYGGGKPIEVVYQLWSIPHRKALRVKCELPLDGLQIRSVVGLWRTADWLEREVYDLFGVQFTGHPDLRRILMPENYAEGHPLRKDFPLRGRFSRAEQTRRALIQEPEDDYMAVEMADREPQLVDGDDESLSLESGE
ncbi:MAG: NADH-quinone oxidoreductase subunit C [Longimicrobiales bacterium]